MSPIPKWHFNKIGKTGGIAQSMALNKNMLSTRQCYWWGGGGIITLLALIEGLSIVIIQGILFRFIKNTIVIHNVKMGQPFVAWIGWSPQHFSDSRSVRFDR